ncbi:MAG TPA: adenosylcobinamide-GDP ribazoletransferase [Solirubrobacterales bacterium]|jgi:adenosylcobinamide-GDP ribazoletransferase
MRAPDLAEAPLAAAAFLTRLPLGPKRDPGADALPRAAPVFPLVGAVLGLAVGGAAIGLAQVVPPLLAGLLAVALELILTGALHVDGLADSADGLGGRDREHSLAIMRDHALGAYGASALTLDLAIKATALASLAEAEALGPIVAALALSRAAPLPLARLLPYAHADGGTGAVLAGRIGTRSILAGVGLALALALAAGAGGEAFFIVLGAAVATVAVGTLASRRFGGVTGDAMGAAVELSAACCLVIAVAVRH